MKRLSFVVAALAMLVPLIGQGAYASGRLATGPHSPVTLIWFMRTDAHENPWENQQVKAFEKLHSNITVKLILAPNANGQFDTKFNTLLNSTPPDIWSHLGQAGFADYYHRGLLYDFTSLIKKYGYNWGHTPTNLINTYRKGSGLYGIPSITLGSFVYYNKDIWDAYNKAHPNAKLAYPPVSWSDKSWTWGKLVDDAIKLTDHAKHIYGLNPGQLWPPMAWAWLAGTDMFPPGSYTTGTPSSVNLTQPAIVKLYQQLASFYTKSKIAPPYSDVNSVNNNGLDIFTTGKIAIEPNGGWGFRTFNNVTFHWAAGALPYDVTDKDVLFTDPYMLYKHTQHPAEAFEFIKFLTSKPAMESYVREVTFTPANPDYLGLWYQTVSAKTGLTQEQLQTLISGARAHGFESPNHLIVNFSEIVNRMKQDTDPIFFGSKSAASQLQVTQSDIDNILQSTP
jgi:multiple sugar transport system substrate-binding protein